ncbi:MAG: alpha-amylase family glycosyl hydrolase, partial [Sphaerochaetaceae bacterium]
MDETTWWKQCVAYKIEPRKFHDSNGDGIGDIVGIISQLPYLRRLGIGCICLSSVFPGMGYGDGGVTEYCSVDPCLGSMADMEDLVDKAHVVGMHVVL